MVVILSTSPVYHFMCSVKKTIGGNQMQKQTNKQTKSKQTNLEHDELNLQMKRACLRTQNNGSNLIEEIWCGQKCLNQV